MKAVCHCEEDTLSHQRLVFLSTTTQTYCKHSFTNGMSAVKCNFWESLLGIRQDHTSLVTSGLCQAVEKHVENRITYS